MNMKTTDRREEIDGIKYEIPTYIDVNRTTKSLGTAHFFSERQKFES